MSFTMLTVRFPPVHKVAAIGVSWAVLAGCSSLPIGAESIAGRYSLSTVNGRAVPVDALGGAVGGELVLSRAGQARRVVQYATSGIPGPITLRASGPFHIRGKEITLDLVEEAHRSDAVRPWRARGEIARERIILRRVDASGAVTEEVYVRVL